MDVNNLRKLYGRLRGIKDVISVQHSIHADVGEDYNNTVESISKIVDEDLNSFKLSQVPHQSEHRGPFYVSDDIRPKLMQLLTYLEYGYNLSQSVIEIGSLYNSITDEELKGRCSDILTAPSNFDRVINQATLVLEDKIRKKSKITESLEGVRLVNKVLNTDISKTILKISDSEDEHQGICHICRGIMQAFRNPTHHHILDKYTREEALKVCAFIDDILHLIDDAEIKN
ncbi:hypothetical protein AMJ44_09630 [candidate division WOR-1 bacterium DG_54_3]|uniref:Conserved hypothetical protein CHP02391 domain-containing protein n=1 Tax=candidate division WOR-1 bacterium DG_54_3 TaxID=1703775 RepID=A0A0S7XTD6_UNCSA|nr:MAG: hypothetical protein AMJ44_09630 [candidate division WOR-1 bacterium DG_54_3]